MQTRSTTFSTALTDKKGKRIGDIEVTVVMKFRNDFTLQSWDISEVTPVGMSNYTLCCWCYERESLDEYLTPVIESVAEGVSEELQNEAEAAERDRENMEETYKTLQSQFV
jgi:hypothetical protein